VGPAPPRAPPGSPPLPLGGPREPLRAPGGPPGGPPPEGSRPSGADAGANPPPPAARRPSHGGQQPWVKPRPTTNRALTCAPRFAAPQHTCWWHIPGQQTRGLQVAPRARHPGIQSARQCFARGRGGLRTRRGPPSQPALLLRRARPAAPRRLAAWRTTQARKPSQRALAQLRTGQRRLPLLAPSGRLLPAGRLPGAAQVGAAALTTCSKAPRPSRDRRGGTACGHQDQAERRACVLSGRQEQGAARSRPQIACDQATARLIGYTGHRMKPPRESLTGSARMSQAPRLPQQDKALCGTWLGGVAVRLLRPLRRNAGHGSARKARPPPVCAAPLSAAARADSATASAPHAGGMPCACTWDVQRSCLARRCTDCRAYAIAAG